MSTLPAYSVTMMKFGCSLANPLINPNPKDPSERLKGIIERHLTILLSGKRLMPLALNMLHTQLRNYLSMIDLEPPKTKVERELLLQEIKSGELGSQIKNAVPVFLEYESRVIGPVFS